MDCLMQFKSTSNDSRKRWHLAFATIYYSRAFSHPNKSSEPYSNTEISPENHVIHVIPPSVPDISQLSLAQLVKNKDLDGLITLGGVGGLVIALKTDVEHGIHADSEDISRRQEAFGTNTYPRPPTESFLRILMELLKPLSIRLYVICNTIAFGIDLKAAGPKERWLTAGTIIFSLVFNYGMVTVIKRWQRQFEKKYKADKNQVDVVRNGRHQQVLMLDIVVGDIVCLKIGDQVPGDGLFAQGHSLQVDEESIRGESERVEVNLDKNPFIFSGTKVVDGCGKIVVTSVGLNTTWGGMMSSVRPGYNERKALCDRLTKLSRILLKIFLAVGIPCCVYSGVHVFKTNLRDEDRKTGFHKRNHTVIDFINGVLGIITQGRLKQQHDCETLDSPANTYTDKAGILSLNHMKVTKFWLGQESMQGRSLNSIASSVLELFHQGVGLNTIGSVYNRDPGSELEYSESPTEEEILSWAALKFNIDMEELKRGSEVLHVEAFNSKEKKSGILVRKKDQTMHVHWKGSVETIIAMCTHFYDSFGNMKSIDDAEKKKFSRIVQGSDLRCIAFAYKQVLDHECCEAARKLKDNGLILLGLVGISDPCQPVEKNVVRVCQNDGVNGRIITRDNFCITKATECTVPGLHQDFYVAVVEDVEFSNSTRMERMRKNIAVLSILRWGKCVYNNIEKLIHSHIAANVAALVVNFMAAILSGEVPLTENQIIWTNLFMEAFAMLPITETPSSWVDLQRGMREFFERPMKELMDERPVGRTEPLKLNLMWKNLIVQTLYQIAVLMTLQFRGEEIFNVNEKVKYTIIFNTFFLCQIFNEFNIRTPEKKHVFEWIHENKVFLKIIGITLVFQVLTLEHLKRISDTERLSLAQWGACVGIASLPCPIDFLVKHIQVPKRTFFISLKWKNMFNTFVDK